VAERGKQHGRKALVEAINKASKEEPPTAEEKELLRGSRNTQRKLLEPESPAECQCWQRPWSYLGENYE
jgi:hypothetical protein